MRQLLSFSDPGCRASFYRATLCYCGMKGPMRCIEWWHCRRSSLTPVTANHLCFTFWVFLHTSGTAEVMIFKFLPSRPYQVLTLWWQTTPPPADIWPTKSRHFRWPWVVFKVIQLLQYFSNAIFVQFASVNTISTHLARSLCDRWASCLDVDLLTIVDVCSFVGCVRPVCRTQLYS